MKGTLEHTRVRKGLPGSFSWAAYWSGLLDFWGIGRSALTIPDSIDNNDVAILPGCGNISATSYLLRTEADFGNVASGYVECRVYFPADGTTGYRLWTSSDETLTTHYVRALILASGKILLTVLNGAGNAVTTVNALSSGWYTIRVESTGTKYIITVNGVIWAFTYTGADDGKWFTYVTDRDNFTIGVQKTTSVSTGDGFLIDYLDFNNTYKWYFTGKGLYEYDVIGTKDLTWVGAGGHSNYSFGSGTYLLDSGFSIWTKGGALDEYVPYGGDTTDIAAAGYVLSETIIGSSAYHNQTPSLLDFGLVVKSSGITDMFNPTIGTYGIPSNSVRTFLSWDRVMRIRKDGNLKYVKFYLDTSNAPDISAVRFQVWRKVAANNYTKVHNETITASIAIGITGVRTIIFSSPLAVLEGDFMGLSITNGATQADTVVYGHTSAVANSLKYQDTDPATGFNWDTGMTANVATYMDIHAFMDKPLIIGFGDSLIAGHSDHYSYVESQVVDNTVLTNQVMYQLRALNANLTYHNAGFGGNTTTHLLTKIDDAVISKRPRFCFLGGGTVDMNLAVANSVTLANIIFMVDRLNEFNIYPIYHLTPPETAATNAKMQQRDLLKPLIISALTGKALVIDLDTTLGQFRVGGDDGNLWDQKAAYNCGDDTHFNEAGYTAWAAYSYAAMVAAGLNFTPFSVSDLFDKSNSTVHIASGSMTYFDSIFPYNWLVSELIDFDTYNAYFNAAYQDRLFTKIEDNLLKEILNCTAKQTGGDLARAKHYCGIT